MDQLSQWFDYSGNTGGLWADIFILIVILITGVFGWRKGIAASIFACVRWVICLVAALFGASPLQAFLDAKFGIQQRIIDRLVTTLTGAVTGRAYYQSIPVQLQKSIAEFTQETALKTATSLADTMTHILMFVLIFVVLALITSLIGKLLSRRDKDDTIGVINGFFGFLFGLFKGVILVGLLMLVLFPLLSRVSPSTAATVAENIRQSHFAVILYDHNPITMFLRLL